MLIPFTDIKGRTYYVNPVYVRVVQTNKKGQTEICMSFSGTGWATANAAIVVELPPEEVAHQLNAAMPLAIDTPLGAIADDDAAHAAANAAVTGATAG
ncbi:MAG: hypothetical protein Tsb0013_17760 [Phycisphaerales bacterium]